MDVYPDSFIFVQYHMWDGYQSPWSDDRWTFHDVQYYPTAIFDGIDLVAGAVHDLDQQYNIYRMNHFLLERSVPTDVTVAISAEHLSGQTYRITTTVGIEAGGAGKTMRVYVLQVLDHWPENKPYHRNYFKQAAPTTDITLAEGGSQDVVHDFTFDTESWDHSENIKIVAWVQAPEDLGPAQVYQAATRPWPLISYPNDADGDGILDPNDNCPQRYNPTQDDGDGDDVGDICDNCDALPNAGQLDEDEDSLGNACDNCPYTHHLNQDDTDADTVGDVCDSCPDVAAPAGVDQLGRPLGAIDLDCDVDAEDFAIIAGCLGGPDVTTAPPGCDSENFTASDLDSDSDVDLADAYVFHRNFTGPLAGPAIYVGVTNCSACHVDQHTAWSDTIHYTAFDTLVAGGDGGNELCFPCHSVGYGQPSGFINLETTPHLADIQCENCHGPGSNHVADPNNVPLTIDLDANLCGACHQSCHGLCGEDHHPQFEQWSTSKHSTALYDLKLQPDAEDNCLQCHSADYRLAAEGEEPTLAEAVFDLECVTCHGPHGSANIGQLRLPPWQLCADCHTMGDAVPGDEPAQPQAETLHGVGGYALDSTPLNGPYSMHWWGIPNECATCHVHKEPYGGPEQPVNSGHMFTANMRACEPCHSEETATMLVQTMREEIEMRLAAIAPYFDPNDPLYVDPGTLSPEDLARYENARFDYEMVIADKSFGSHSPDYTRALLSEAESFFGIPPWYFPDPGPFEEPRDMIKPRPKRVEVCP